ncbi:hypothetical protein EOT10_27860 [Streptomyces antnestii]|uniref:2OG-Fe dioxygenase family protein n=2 Tax=Streptomyces antnestii TaxID=2494256 RepID=A0A437PEH5_9ACTN|nr:hypothetical protein EOT10_27860 [Streptomyces sp. San01]
MTVHKALAAIDDIKAQYTRDRVAFIKGEDLIDILSAFGATPESIEDFKKVTEDLPPDPTLDFRKARNGRFCIDPANGQAYRTEFQPFVLSAEEDFVRHDSGKTRHFAEMDNNTQLNPTFKALLIFKALIAGDLQILHRPFQDYNTDKWICTVFHTRTITTPQLTGEPALEGVHADGVDHTMTVFLGGRNMTEDSAITRIHDNAEKNATHWGQVDPELQFGVMQHRNFLDTILIVDHERKHSVSTIAAQDADQSAWRDMLVFFTRKPALEGHASSGLDSTAPHSELPMSVQLPAAS